MPYLDDPRVLFAAERTLLAWQRTALALMGFGFVVERFGLLMRMASVQPLSASQRGFSLWLGVGLLVGAAVAAVSALQFRLPCPLCGGTDRFQYTDKFGEGNYHCRHCGPGGGFKLLQAAKGIDFNTALQEVERCVGSVPSAPRQPLAEPAPDRMNVGADPNLSHCADRILSQGWKPTLSRSAVDKFSS